MENVREEITIDKIIEKAIASYEKKQNAKFKQRVFRNTKLLMENYNDFKNHINYSVSDIKDLQRIVDIDLEENDYDELFISSIKQSKFKTMIITTHIEFALTTLEKEECEEGTLEKYKALKMYYIDKKGYEKISEELNTSVITSRRWVKEMIDKLGILLFGVDYIKL